jgi:hypothetical protein
MPSPHESEPVAAARRALGRRLAALRQAAGYSQAEFAPLTGYGRSTLANVETGRQHVPRGFWERCGGELAAPELPADYETIEAMLTAERQAAAERAQAEREARVNTWRKSRAPRAPEGTGAPPWPGWAGTAGHALRQTAELWPRDLDGCGTLPGEAGETAAVLLRWVTAPPDRPPCRAAVNPGIGEEDVRRMRGVRARLKDIDNAHGGGVAFPMVVSYLRGEVAMLLTGSRDEATGHAMLEAVAELELDAGWCAYDAEDHRLGRSYLLHALRLAHAAGNRLLGARITCGLSHQALHVGHHALSVDLARAARIGAGPAATPRAVAMLAAMEAMAHAGSGDASSCRAAFDDAERALASATAQDADPDWLDFDQGGLLGHKARAFRDLAATGLESAKTAGEHAGRSAALSNPGHGRTRAQRTAILATAWLQLGEIDRAAAAGEQVVQAAWLLNSRHVEADIATLLAAIEPTRSRAIGDFTEQARDFLTRRAPTRC